MHLEFSVYLKPTVLISFTIFKMSPVPGYELMQDFRHVDITYELVNMRKLTYNEDAEKQSEKYDVG